MSVHELLIVIELNHDKKTTTTLASVLLRPS